MMMMRKGLLIWVGVVLLALNGLAAELKKVYENNFEKSEPGKVPEDFLVLDGAFAVKEEGGNKSLELPGAPLDTFGLLFGPTEPANITVSARVFGTGKGRRFPTFALGLNGVGGLKLQVSPGKKMLELYKGEEVLATAPYSWESGAWTMLRLQLRKVKEGEFKVQGKVWKQGGKEPDAWMIDYTLLGDLPAGRASIWGNPYSGTPILYDDLSLATIGS
jgi:hypothetical protein